MKSAVRRPLPAPGWLLILLIVASLACAQAGEVLTPAEATERVEQNITVPGASDVEGNYAIGDTVTLTGRSFLVNLVSEPGGRIVAGQERGAEVTVQNIAEFNGEIWYQVTAGTGTGWVRAENLEPVEAAEQPTEEGETEEGATATEGGVAAGDTVYLTGVGFLVNLYNEPGGRIVATQERGAAVTVLALSQHEGATWYQIQAPTGQGWVAEDNVTTEAP